MKHCYAILQRMLLIPLLCCLQSGTLFAASAEVSAASTSAYQQKQKISGVVVDATTNEPIIGVSVIEKGTNNGYVTGTDGQFTLSVNKGATLLISYLGYQSQEIKVTSSDTKFTIKLKDDAVAVEDVVVTAFGTTQKKESIVGSISSTSPADLVVPSSNLSTAFAGRLSGVIAYQRSGEPGSNAANFFIRGIATFSGSTNPLIIIDGVQVATADLNALDPEVIESFSILKDATATAMYGTRGANGVMIVKTKSGLNTEKPIIGFRFETNVTQPTEIPKFADGATYMRMFNESIDNQQVSDTKYTDERIYGVQNHLDPYIFPNVDWYNEIFNNYAWNQKANFNIRGGTNKITYFMNMAMNHETGMLKNRSQDYFSYKNNIDLTKFAFQNNIDFHMSRTATIALHLNAQLNSKRSPYNSTGTIYGAIMNTNPSDFPITFPSSDEDVEAGIDWIKWGALSGGNTEGAANPMALLTNGYANSFESTVVANIDYDQKLDFITEGLHFKGLVSFKNWAYSSTARSQGYNRYYVNGFSRNDDGTYDYTLDSMGEPSKQTLGYDTSQNGDRSFYVQAYLDYNRTFGDDHNVSGMLLYNQTQYNTAAPGSLWETLPERKMGFAARVNYDYAHRYMLEANVGYNGSEGFAAGHRWGWFPSVAVGWNVSQEPFWKSIEDVVSNLKVRASYGLVGNDSGAARFMYIEKITLQGIGFTTGYGNSQTYKAGPTYDQYKNEDITWEVGRKFNLGIDMQFFRDFNLSVDVYQEIRSNIFLQRQSIPNYLGTANSTIYGNLGKVKNQGIDLSLDVNHRFGRDLMVQFKGTFTYAHNTILDYDEALGKRPANSYKNHSMNQIYGYVSNGLYIDQNDITNNPTSLISTTTIQPGDIKYVDQPDAEGIYDGKITSDDQVAMGFPTVPEVVYGFGPSLVWRNWDFSFFFQGAARVSLMMSGFHPFGTGYNRNVLQWIADDYWSEDNQNPFAGYPRLAKYNNGNNTASSDYWLRDASFLKLKNVELGYSFKSLRVYVSATNLLTFSPFKLWDPEQGGGAGLSYPTQRILNVGLQMTFK